MTGGKPNVPAVSVAMAAKNYARFLPAAIGSVLAQTWGDWELVVVDDGSTDDTPRVIRPYLADPRIKYVRSDRLGQARAKSLAARLGRGPIVAFLDADDVWFPTKLEKQLAILRAQPDVGVCFCRRSLIDEDGRPLPALPAPPIPRGRVLTDIFLRNFVCFSSTLVRREVLDRVGLFDLEWELSIDYDLWLRAARHYEFDYVDEELVLYRTGHGNLSKRLADRVAVADSIMTRAIDRRGLGAELPPAAIAEGYTSTYIALAYTLRPSEPLAAARWYWEALKWPARRGEVARGLVASALAWVRGRRTTGAAENAAVNR
ncbi:glycosyltransferase family 2 protein [Fimbriiglobus ruber]|uniref:Glycosyltransferase n=1 Tax=Fimbriiglobus ruber TaxID=1908690 RepID=A0A225E479_9BACT|nr:glycosyltransferase [Fimbriiglobus ruber]OWK43217.1 Glycosyltransferase [Fimbriiglobus ruber]